MLDLGGLIGQKSRHRLKGPHPIFALVWLFIHARLWRADNFNPVGPNFFCPYLSSPTQQGIELSH